MAERVYLDTNAFRYFGEAFKTETLPFDLRERILMSPLSAFEVMKQLADAYGDVVLQQIQCIRNWTNSQHAGLLPPSQDVMHSIWFQKPVQDNGTTKRMQDSINVVLNTDSPKDIQEESQKHKQFMIDLKLQAAQSFKTMIEYARNNKFDMTDAWFRGIAKSVGADPKSRSVDEIKTALSAYHEYEQAKLKVALDESEYNPLSLTNQNDIIDAEQLVYLWDPTLCFLTADKKVKNRVKASVQASRIIWAPAEDLQDPARATALLRKIVADRLTRKV
jgi:hypothetical protein